MNNQSDIASVSKKRQLWRLFGVTYVAMLNAKKKALEPDGVQLARGWAMWGLKAMGRPATITEMAQILDRDRQATAQLFKRMESDGLVERRKGTSNGNAITVSLTPEGDALLERIYKADATSGEFMDCLTDEELDFLEGCLHKLRKEVLHQIKVQRQWLPDAYTSMLGLSVTDAPASSSEGTGRKRPGV